MKIHLKDFPNQVGNRCNLPIGIDITEFKMDDIVAMVTT